MPIDPLEEFIDEGIRQAEAKGYHPSEFIRMRRDHNTVPAIEQLVKSGQVQSGFIRFQKLCILEWSIEEAVRKFPDKFSGDARACAEFRLNNISDNA